MIKVDLITGFLGSGKTTFLKKYARYLMDQGMKVGILENDHGAVNVDMMLFQDIEGDNCGLEMVAGGCDPDCHKRRFKTKLIAMGMSGYDRVIIEPSGIFDMDEFFDTLHEDPLDRWYEIGSVIAIVDGELEDELSDTSRYLLASQVTHAGKVLISKISDSDESNDELTVDNSKSRVMNIVNESLEMYQCRKIPDARVIAKDWETLDDEDFKKVMNASYVGSSIVKSVRLDDQSYTTYYYMNHTISAERIKDVIESCLKDSTCGNIIRIKGFLEDGDHYIEANATKSDISLKPIAKGQQILIVIGENLNKEKIDLYFA